MSLLRFLGRSRRLGHVQQCMRDELPEIEGARPCSRIRLAKGRDFMRDVLCRADGGGRLSGEGANWRRSAGHPGGADLSK